uniref:Uncharacterized protein n=1 Tax=Anguilla anguilla TaxID=7936 RepID=A0A0E9V067_ANGAN
MCSFTGLNLIETCLLIGLNV